MSMAELAAHMETCAFAEEPCAFCGTTYRRPALLAQVVQGDAIVRERTRAAPSRALPGPVDLIRMDYLAL